MSGFQVNPEELHQFAGRLDAHHGTAGEIAGLVAKADVSNKSWGVVGLAVFDDYTTLLNDLKDLFTDMQDGLRSGSDKFRGTAQGYVDQDMALKKLFDGVQIEIDR